MNDDDDDDDLYNTFWSEYEDNDFVKSIVLKYTEQFPDCKTLISIMGNHTYEDTKFILNELIESIDQDNNLEEILERLIVLERLLSLIGYRNEPEYMERSDMFINGLFKLLGN